MMKSILIATDGSDQAVKALRIGGALANKFGSRVVVLHVLMRGASFDSVYRAFKAQGLSTDALDELVNVPTTGFGFDMSGPVTPIVPLVELGRLGQCVLDGAKKVLAGEGVTNVTTLMEDGEPADIIVGTAQKQAVDTIVMGHRGLGAFQELVMGSVSTKVGHRATCTVIAVK